MNSPIYERDHESHPRRRAEESEYRQGRSDRSRSPRGRTRETHDRSKPVFRLFIRNLAFRTNWRDLKDYFNDKVGNVQYTEVAESSDGRSRGFGVVDFLDKETADRALRELNEVEFMGRTIYLKELPFTFTWSDLKELFSEAGKDAEYFITCKAPVKRTMIADEREGRSRGFGYVLYSNKEDAALAIEKFNGYDLSGRTISVHEERTLKIKSKYFGPRDRSRSRSPRRRYSSRERGGYDRRAARSRSPPRFSKDRHDDDRDYNRGDRSRERNGRFDRDRSPPHRSRDYSSDRNNDGYGRR